MPTSTLESFITANRDELIRRCREKVGKRLNPLPTPAEIDSGVPVFLDQMIVQLQGAQSNTRAIKSTATQHGRDLFFQGLTIGQVVHDYGDVCQSVTELAGELSNGVSTDDFRTLNRCLDDAIAGAVSEFSHQQHVATDGKSAGQAMELRNLLYTAITAFEVLQTGSVGVAGSTGSLVHRSLLAMRSRV
jgi:hypothetical protein